VVTVGDGENQLRLLKHSSLWKLREFGSAIRVVFVAALLSMGLTAWLEIVAVWKTADVFNPLFESIEAAASDAAKAASLDELYVAALHLLLFTSLAAISNGVAMYLGAWVGQRIVFDLRQKLFEKLQSLSLRYFDRHRSGDLLSRINNDTAVIQATVGQELTRLVIAPMAVLFAVIKMVSASWRLTLGIGIALPIIAAVTLLVGRYMRRYSMRVQEHLADLMSVAEENLGAIRVVKVFGLEDELTERFYAKNVGVLGGQMKAALMRAVSNPFVLLFVGVALCATLVYGGHELAAGRINEGSGGLIAFILLLQVAGTQVNRLSRLHLTVQTAEAAAGRVYDIFAEEADITEADDAIEMDDLKGAISFENVNFGYNDDEPVLENFNLEIAAGETVAIAGPSGGGKSTVANLVPRLYDVDDGAVKIDGVDVRRLKNSFLKSVMGIVPQQTVLFSASVSENIAFGKPGAREAEVIAAAKAARCDEFISQLPKGYDTQVGERGVMLSGGQRQRIAIARALLRAPKIIILDEATSSLDTSTERAIHDALQTLLEDRTAIIIAHRLSTIRDADRILVMEDGRIVEEGHHEALMAAGGLYKQLYETKALLANDEV
jgi:ATP-binding cassette, subfamily B, bacterial MsbA